MLVSNDKNPEQISLIYNVKQLLFELGFAFAWINQGVQFETSFINQIRQRLRDVYIQQCNCEKNATSSSRLFKHIKSTFYFENCLCLESIIQKSINKSQIKFSFFFIERGRWAKSKIAVKDRTCTLCNSVEDEFHCIVECPRFRIERKGCLPEKLSNKPSMYDFVNLFKCVDIKTCENLGLLCFKILRSYEKTHLTE